MAARLLIMLSGGGRTMLNLDRAIRAGMLPARIAGVVVSRACAGADRARELGIPVHTAPGDISGPDLETLVRDAGADWVVLAGYLRRLPIPAALTGTIVNIHPALLPDFGGPGMYGERVHRAVLAAGVGESGCTVHLCDEQYDHGPVVLQGRCPVLSGDTVETLAARVFEVECRTYPRALRMLIERSAD